MSNAMLQRITELGYWCGVILGMIFMVILMNSIKKTSDRYKKFSWGARVLLWSVVFAVAIFLVSPFLAGVTTLLLKLFQLMPNYKSIEIVEMAQILATILVAVVFANRSFPENKNV